MTRPVWLYDPQKWREQTTAHGETHARLRSRIVKELEVLIAEDTVRIV